jgi:hypothetical protein
MNYMRENAMGVDLNQAGEPKKGIGQVASAIFHDLDKQRLRILRCTAKAMASSPGGLRFQAGTRPWLEGILDDLPASSRLDGRRRTTVLLPAAP